MPKSTRTKITNPSYTTGKIPKPLGQSPPVLPVQLPKHRQIVASKRVLITSGRKSV